MSSSDEIRVQILLVQYEKAIQLYQHEDSLNWQKINHTLIVNGCILAALQFVDQTTLIFRILAATASVAAVILLITIRNGYRYVELHKAAIDRVEQELAKCGGLPTFIASDKKLGHRLRTSTAISIFLALLSLAWAFISWKGVF
ncbi:MAG: hypothetical protein A3F83_01355 [Candidatus Glassbacteria bacterium RIFCSPLOWO2_12_FULL_58_11]|uniref:Uncharacterized protein n=1 Tax=Candidatus Glassbacteria bacterium RIFCSPLOWO2_12_FULL_58_11 TaxID=1817867 RepID=A0A1F5YLC6_9BACT|nr:MAG: hypothetical protein A3F83_01355 [Candidatus Glassbacteria bacterium RIFCSPLOWO2_12_FULL_58_11]